MPTKLFTMLTTALLAVMLLSACAKEQHTVVTIHEDGSVSMNSEMVMQRDMAEQMTAHYRNWEDADQSERMWEQGWDDEEEDAEDVEASLEEAADDVAAAAEGETTEPAPELTQAEKDTQLEKAIRTMFEQSYTHMNQHVEPTLEKVEISAETVRIASATRFENLESFVGASPMQMGNAGVNRLVVDKTDEGNLHLTFSSAPGRMNVHMRQRMEQQRKQMLRMNKVKGSVKIVLPGKVTSSSLPTVEENSTSFAFDTADEASLAIMEKLLTEPIVIVAEPGKLDLAGVPLPLDSQKLMQRFYGRGQGMSGEDMPIEDAAEGYRAEAVSATTRATHYYPDAAQALGPQAPYMLQQQQNQCAIRARIYAPEGRNILASGAIKVLSAVDDQGRPLALEHEGDEFDYGYTQYSSGNGDNEQRKADVSINLPLPAPDVEAIEELEGEAILTTFSAWKEHAISDFKADPAVEIDLGDVLPGVKMIIEKMKHRVRGQHGATQIEGRVLVNITGPEEVQKLDLKVRFANLDSNAVQTYAYMDQYTGDKRRLMLQYNAWNHDEGAPPSGAPTLVVRLPDGMRRERVKFTLTAMDLQ